MKVFVGFGCPRSGTTFLYHCLQALEPVGCVIKLTENHALHPAKSRNGLSELAQLFKAHELTIVRSVRHPLEIAESFLAARTNKLLGNMPGIARNTDADIAHWVREESLSVMVQRPRLAEWEHVRFLEMRDEAMKTKDGKDQFWRELAKGVDDREATDELRRRIEQYGKKPVRSGRMSAKLGKVSTDDERLFFKTRLKPALKREGYGG